MHFIIILYNIKIIKSTSNRQKVNQAHVNTCLVFFVQIYPYMVQECACRVLEHQALLIFIASSLFFFKLGDQNDESCEVD